MNGKSRLASYVPKGKENHSDGTGNEERPLRGTNPNRPDGGRCLHSLRT